MVNVAAAHNAAHKKPKSKESHHHSHTTHHQSNNIADESVLLSVIHQNERHREGGGPRRGSVAEMVEIRERVPHGRSASYVFGQDKEPEPETCANQKAIREKYESPAVQISVAGLIFANFIVSGIQSEIYPGQDPNPGSFFYVMEWLFGIIFLIELIWNMYGSWLLPFWQSGWNIFDFFIVLISLLSLMMSDLPGIAVLRLFRAFRVFRLFKRIKSLRMIIDGVLASLPGVGNAFLVLGILMGIWSIMGVEFFGAEAEQEFGSFSRAMFTMWQVMTMDGWSSDIARPLIFKEADAPEIENSQNPGQFISGIYFISYTFIAGIIMTNVVVAILLENYLAATTSEDNEDNSMSTREKIEACEADIELFEKILKSFETSLRVDTNHVEDFKLRLEEEKKELKLLQQAYVALLLQELSSDSTSTESVARTNVPLEVERKPDYKSAKVNPTLTDASDEKMTPTTDEDSDLAVQDFEVDSTPTSATRTLQQA